MRLAAAIAELRSLGIMTRAEIKWSVVLMSLPSALIVTVGMPMFWMLKDSSGHDWLFWIFVGLVPVSFVAGLLGSLFAFERSLARGVRACLFLLNGSSAVFGLYLAITLVQAVTAWRHYHSY
jgi:hypothetical protein